MSEQNKLILINRLKSLAWRLGNIIAIALLAFITDNVGLLELPDYMIVLTGLVTAEITKYLNSKTV